eukprot:XP_001699116.1 predicted protein [Chlamydomonas reinhardtii]
MRVPIGEEHSPRKSLSSRAALFLAAVCLNLAAADASASVELAPAAASTARELVLALVAANASRTLSRVVIITNDIFMTEASWDGFPGVVVASRLHLRGQRADGSTVRPVLDLGFVTGKASSYVQNDDG